MSKKHSEAQLSKIIQSGGFLSNIIGKLGKNTQMKFAVWRNTFCHN